MNTWDKLSMTEKAEIMKLAVDGGIYDLDTIKDVYNKFAEGGHKEDSSWTMENEAKYREWRNSLPDNLRNTDDRIYDMRGAYKAGMQPSLEADGYYHLQSRDPRTGRILKSSLHPTYLQALTEDARMGYYPTVDNKGNTYTQTWEGNQFKSGGSIHIKPSHKGRLTELKARTGKSESELYNDGNPAHKKMVVFARNARKWHHAYGGVLDANDNMFLTGGPKRGRMPAHPRNREKDPEAYDAAKKWQEEQQLRRQQQEEQNRIYAEEKARSNEAAAKELNRRKDTVMSALSNIANSTPFTGSEVAEAAENQRQEKLDKWHDLKLGMDATMTAAELTAAGYGVVRGLTHANRWLARQAAQSTGQAVSREAMQNLLKWNNRVNKIDKAQVAMNTLGGIADGYQWATANNSFDAWENGLETGANAAGVVGGMNWFRDLPYLRRIGGDKIDAVLDGMGYSAAAWDVVKNLPPLSGALEGIREQSKKEEKAYGGEMGNYYDGWGDAWNFLKTGVQKARQKVKDWGLDKSPAAHLSERLEKSSKDIKDNRNPEFSNGTIALLDVGRLLGLNSTIKGSDNDMHYRQNLYNLVDPTNVIPESMGDYLDYANIVRHAKSDKDYKYRRVKKDPTADAAWAKRLELPYDSTLLISNPDGSVHLSEQLENEIPTDTTFIKQRIADNNRLLKSTYGPKRGDIEAALSIDSVALDNLRHTYRTGEPVEMNEFSHNSRNLRTNNETSPLNILHRYTLQYNPGDNTMGYRDTYNFDGLEDYVPGKPFEIKGTIDLKKKKK